MLSSVVNDFGVAHLSSYYIRAADSCTYAHTVLANY